VIRAKGAVLGAPNFSGTLGTDGYYTKIANVAHPSPGGPIVAALLVCYPGAESRAHENVRRAIAKPPSFWKRLGKWLP